MIQEIIESFKELSDPARIELAERTYPTQMEVIGVTVPNLKQVLKEVKIKMKSRSPEEKLQFMKELVNADIFECQQLAYEFIGKDKMILRILTENDIDELGKNLDNWVSVDYYAALIVGYAWREGIIDIQKVKSFLESDNFWIRRIAIVATVALNQKARGGTGDSKQTLAVCRLVVDDHVDMINKALSWALRELAKIEKQPVVDFIEKYEDRLNKRVLREVRNKLDFGTKNR